MQRRNFLQVAAAGAAVWPCGPARQPERQTPSRSSTRIFISSIPRGPAGVPWPTPDDCRLQTCSAPRYAALSAAFGVRGASPLRQAAGHGQRLALGVAERIR